MEEQFITVLDGLGYRAAWGGLGQGTALPRIALYRISGVDDTTLDGRSGYLRGRVQVDCYGQDFDEALTVSRTVTAALSGYKGGAIWHCALDSIRDRPDEAGGEVLQRVSLDFTVLYAEA